MNGRDRDYTAPILSAATTASRGTGPWRRALAGAGRLRAPRPASQPACAAGIRHDPGPELQLLPIHRARQTSERSHKIRPHTNPTRSRNSAIPATSRLARELAGGGCRKAAGSRLEHGPPNG